MQPFTFIHAADLHLDAVFPSPPGEDGPALREILASAAFMALGRLVDLCITQKTAFLILAGDVFHSGAGSLKAGFELSDAFKKLGEHGIDVFWARGNHDSLSQSGDARAWPENVHIFSHEGERVSAAGGLAELHGISHKSQHERGNLAENLKGSGSGFGIGVLHCAVNGAQGSHIAYAPCNLSDLTGGGKDYWALGHVHGQAVLAQKPLVVYPGSLQGLHVNEPGPHGCYIVAVGADGRPEASFTPLAPVRWERMALDISGQDNLDALEDAALEAVRGLCDELGREETTPELLLLRLELGGRTALDAALRRSGSTLELAERLNRGLAAMSDGMPCQARLKDIVLATSPDLDVEALKRSDNLVGETLRRADEVAARLDELAVAGVSGFEGLKAALTGTTWADEFSAALEELYGDRRVEEHELMPGLGELGEMAREAASLCLHLFEVEE